MATRKLITKCVVMIAACVLAYSARAQNTCTAANLWVNGTFEDPVAGDQCNIYNPVNVVSNPNPPWNGRSQFFCQPFSDIPVQGLLVMEANIDHTLGTDMGHYLYVDPRISTGTTPQISQNIEVMGGTYTFSAWVCPMTFNVNGNVFPEVNLTVGGFSSAWTLLNNTTPNGWQQITLTVTLPAGIHTASINVLDPTIGGDDFAIDDIEFGPDEIMVDAGPDQQTCNSVPIVLGGSPTARFGASCGNYQYNWTPAAGLSSNSVSNPTLTLNIPGTYAYTVTVTDMNGQTCNDDVEIVITGCGPSKCPIPNLWVNGTFEDLAVGSMCNMYNPLNFLPGYPYYGSTSFIHPENGITYPGVNQVTQDHTPVGGVGHYLYVDPRSNIGLTPQVSQQIKVMPGGIYTFSAWVCSMLGAVPFWPAIVELRVNGMPLNIVPSNTVTLNSFTPNGWIQIQGKYQYTGLAPAYINASIVLHNPVVTGCDFAIDDVYFGDGILIANAGPDALVCPNTPHVLGGSPTADFGATCGNNYTYSWSPTTGLLPSATVANPTVMLGSGSQTYTVTVTDLNGQTCQDEVTVNVLPFCRTKANGESAQEEPIALTQNSNEINIYPIPANDVVHITTSHDRPLQVTVYNAMGQKIIERKMSNKLDLDVKSWAKEVYYIHLVDEQNGERIVKSIVIR